MTDTEDRAADVAAVVAAVANGLRTELREQSAFHVKLGLSRCWHPRIEVHDHNAELVCRDCGEKVNAVWWISHHLTKWARYQYLVKAEEAKLQAIYKRIDAAKRELRSLEGKIKRRKAKL